jgi:hypothetical protein
MHHHGLALDVAGDLGMYIPYDMLNLWSQENLDFIDLLCACDADEGIDITQASVRIRS